MTATVPATVHAPTAGSREAPAARAGGATPVLDLLAFVLAGFSFSRVSESVESTTGSPPLSTVLAIVVLAVVGLRRGGRHEPRSMAPVATALAALNLAVSLLSAVGAKDGGLALEGLDGQLRAVLVMLAVVAIVRTPRRLDLALWGIVAATLVVGVANVGQALTGAYDVDVLGLARPELAALDTESGWRLGGPLGDPNFFAQMLAAGVAASLACALLSSGRARLVAVAATLAGAAALPWTYSRGGLVAVLVAVAVVAGRLLSWRALLVGAAVLGLLVAAAPEAMTGRVATAVEASPRALSGQRVPDTAVAGRASEALVGYEQFSDHWLLGVGTGNYAAHYLDYASSLGLDSRREDRAAHSMAIETMAETGMVGVLVLTVTIGAAFASTGRLRRVAGRDEPGLRRGAVAVEGALVAHLTCALFLHTAYPRGYWLLLGLALACGQVRPSHDGSAA